MISDLHNNDDATLPRTKHQPRLEIKPGTAVRRTVDGAWWPRSTDPAAEFPALVMASSSWIGPARHVAYHPDDWDPAENTLIVENWAVHVEGSHAIPANTVVVTGPDLKQVRLLVVPPTTPGGVARAVLRSASRSDTVTTVEEILVSNGVSLGERPKMGLRP